MMGSYRIDLAGADDRNGFWRQAPVLAAAGVNEAAIDFSVKGTTGDLFARVNEDVIAATTAGQSRVSDVPRQVRSFLDPVLLHRDPERFRLAFRILQRLKTNPHLMHVASDSDIARARTAAQAVRRDQHNMTAFVRFKKIFCNGAGERFIAWFEPDHHIIAATAPFFVRRFTTMQWSILSPARSAHWDGEALTFGEGATLPECANSDPLEDVWRTYYAHIFNPARLKVKSMQGHMPKKYWRHLPESRLIGNMVSTARSREDAMVAAEPTRRRRPLAISAHNIPSPERSPLVTRPSGGSQECALSEIARSLNACRRCSLHCHATQAVMGEGLPSAKLMIVGEQPGDLEDLAGRPFVGPSGKILDAALDRCGIARQGIYVTNAVKHFKYEPRGKARLHKSPNASEIDHCRWWLDLERRAINPRLILALGSSAARAILGRQTKIGENRGRIFRLDDESHALITAHPSYLLRLQSPADKRAEWDAFVADFRLAVSWLGDDLEARQPTLEARPH